MSWFSAESFKGLADGLKEKAQQVQNSIQIDNKMLEKLTLTTPELVAERQRIDAEELRKEAVRDALAGMFPWETRDPDRDILVEECKEAILKLSESKETFFGPFQMPETKVKTDEGGEQVKQDIPPETSKKLEKLHPLPPLLRDFDLDSHVGLIRKLLQVDKKLVEMQSKYSGGGSREKVFWHNYFFHCAFARYEAGMSIDEIWSDQPLEKPEAVSNEDDDEEEEVNFEAEETPREKVFTAPEPTIDSDQPFESTQDDESPITGSSNTAEFEFVGEESGDDEEINPDDYELDELEAEIARELED